MQNAGRENPFNRIRDLEAENDRLRQALETSEKRFATLKEAYDRERRRGVQITGSALSPDRQTEDKP